MAKAQWLQVVVILIVGVLLRFVWLDRIPSAIGGDELTYILEAKSIALTGRDLSGTWNPLTVFLFTYPPGELQAELPYLINLPAMGIFQFSLFSARLTSAVLSVLTLLGFYLLVRELFNSRIALVAGSIAAINPWGIYIGRTAYDMVPAVCFYVWAMYIMVAAKGKYLLWSLPLFILAFYSYIGTKIIFFPIILATCLYVVNEYPERRNKKNAVILLFASAIFISFFIISLFITKSPTRITDIINLSDPLITQAVDTIRKSSIRSPLVDMYVNKYTITLSILTTKLLRSLSSTYLFAYGDNFVSFYSHGLFYVIDFVFLILGIVTMYAKRMRKMIYMCIFTFIAIVPHLIHSANTNDFTPHLAMMFPFLMVFIGYGIYEVMNFPKPKYRIYMVLTVLGLYGLSLGNFLQLYWFQRPLSGQFDFPIRVMSKYVQLQKKNEAVVVYSTRTIDMYKKYLFYSDGIRPETIAAIRQALASNYIHLNKVTFLGCDQKLVIPTGSVILYDSECGSLPGNEGFLKITRLTDGGTDFKIYNDSMCSQYALKPYPSNFTIADLNIEKLNTKAFCESYIVR